MREEAKDLLYCAIEDASDMASTLEPGSKEREAEIENIVKLCNVLNESDKVSNNCQNDKAKERNEWIRLAATLAVNVGLSLISLSAYNHWYNRGLRFHQTDSLTEPMTKNLVSKMTNLLPWMRV